MLLLCIRPNCLNHGLGYVLTSGFLPSIWNSFELTLRVQCWFLFDKTQRNVLVSLSLSSLMNFVVGYIWKMSYFESTQYFRLLIRNMWPQFPKKKCQNKRANSRKCAQGELERNVAWRISKHEVACCFPSQESVNATQAAVSFYRECTKNYIRIRGRLLKQSQYTSNNENY